MYIHTCTCICLLCVGPNSLVGERANVLGVADDGDTAQSLPAQIRAQVL